MQFQYFVTLKPIYQLLGLEGLSHETQKVSLLFEWSQDMLIKASIYRDANLLKIYS